MAFTSKLKIKHILFALLLLLIVYLFWGPLFPWSPLKPGFKKLESSKATVYITDYDGENVVYQLDEMIREQEEYHDLQFQKPFKVIVLGKESNMKRYLPWLKGSGYSVKLGALNVIYIGSNARNSEYGIGVYMKHEISHLLIHQNTPSSQNSKVILNQAWLAEGAATYFGGPQYYEKDEFTRAWTARGMHFDGLYMENPHKMDRSIIRLKYTYYRYFIEFLVETYGIGKFQDYLKQYMVQPQNYEALFPEIYSLGLNEIFREFNDYMNPDGTNR